MSHYNMEMIMVNDYGIQYSPKGGQYFCMKTLKACGALIILMAGFSLSCLALSDYA